MCDENYWAAMRVRTLQFLVDVSHLAGETRAFQLTQTGIDNFDEPSDFYAAIVLLAKEGEIVVPAGLDIDGWDGNSKTAFAYAREIVRVYEMPAP